MTPTPRDLLDDHVHTVYAVTTDHDTEENTEHPSVTITYYSRSNVHNRAWCSISDIFCSDHMDACDIDTMCTHPARNSTTSARMHAQTGVQTSISMSSRALVLVGLGARSRRSAAAGFVLYMSLCMFTLLLSLRLSL